MMKYSEEIHAFIRENVEGRNIKQLVEIVNLRFDCGMTESKMKSYKKNRGLKSGLDGRFQKGHEPSNKNKKGVYAPGCEKSWFKKGHTPINFKPVGSERIDTDGYTLVKTKDPNIWTLKHRILWEQSNGPVPKGYKLLFKDANPQNITLENLMLITDFEMLVLNRKKLIFQDPELTKTGVLIAKLDNKIYRRRKEKSK